jgi:predicted metal-dependent peptidase
MSFSDLLLDWCISEPFYSDCLAQLRRSPVQSSKTGLDFALKMDQQGAVILEHPTELLEPEQAALLLKHELLHLLFGHPQQAAAFSEPAIYELAADLVVNQYLPGLSSPFSLENLANLGLVLPAGLASGDYYELLLAQKGTLLPLLNQGQKQLWTHRFWPQFQQQAKPALAALSQNHGHFPADLLRQIEIENQAPTLPWPRLLQHFLKRTLRSKLKNTSRRISKRYGTIPGTKRVPQGRILAAIDTSASVNEQALNDFWNEIEKLAQHGFDLKIAECDTRIQRLYPWRGERPKSVRGGGGTNFDPVLQLTHAPFRPDLLLYFSDGDGPTPLVKPHIPMLWVLCGPKANADLPGEKIYLRGGKNCNSM